MRQRRRPPRPNTRTLPHPFFFFRFHFFFFLSCTTMQFLAPKLPSPLPPFPSRLAELSFPPPNSSRASAFPPRAPFCLLLPVPALALVPASLSCSFCPPSLKSAFAPRFASLFSVRFCKHRPQRRESTLDRKGGKRALESHLHVRGSRARARSRFACLHLPRIAGRSLRRFDRIPHLHATSNRPAFVSARLRGRNSQRTQFLARDRGPEEWRSKGGPRARGWGGPL